MPQLEVMLKRRSNIKGSLTKIVRYAIAQNEFEGPQLDVEQLKVRLRRADTLLIEFSEIEQAISAIKSDDESQQDDFEDKYYNAVADLNKLIRKANMAVGNLSIELNSTQGEQTRTSNIEVKLPKINIVPFSGSYQEWQSFFDLFASTIHENPNLHPAQKFQYLKGLLRGEAANLLKHLPISDANYIEALSKLKTRYDRKRYTVQSFIKSFFEIPTIHNATSLQIRKLMDTADEVIRGLKAVGPEAETRDPWLVFLMVQKLDEETRDKWATETGDSEFPTCQALIKFLSKRADALDAARSFPRKTGSQVKAAPKVFTNVVASCEVCQDNYHPLYQCPKFKDWSIEERRNYMKSDNRCFNCLSKSHRVSQCRSKGRCHTCKGNHNSLLHLDGKVDSSNKTQLENSNRPGSSTDFLANNCTLSLTSAQPLLPSSDDSNYHPAVLPTATVRIQGNGGQNQLCRVLLDSGSQSSFITEAFVQKLGLKRTYGKIIIKGLANQRLMTTRGIVKITISPHFESAFTTKVCAHVVPFLTTVKAINQFELLKQQRTPPWPLADTSIRSTTKIDMLIGADKFFEILKPDQVRDSRNKIYAHSTHFGWIVTGKVPHTGESSQCNTIIDNSTLERQLKRFWECEEVFKGTPMLPEDQICEELFQSTTKRLNDNHFMVRLPFKSERSPLRDSFNIAVKRLYAVERKLVKNPTLQKQYVEFMEEYCNLGHMIEVEPPRQPSEFVYLPHHAVLKETSTTTKLRVVFDASAKTSSGFSLNDNLLTGPTLQNVIGDILLRFRTHQIVFIADAEKMFRQIWIHPDDCKYQRIVWRKTPEENIKHFQLRTLTYGMSSAPYLATRVIQQIADNNKNQHPIASETLLKDMYIDDLLTGARNIPEAINLARQISQLMMQSGFNLRKWSSNSPEVLSKLTAEETYTSIPKSLSKDQQEVKVLGLQWHPTSDTFTYRVTLADKIPKTKRAILSEASRIFDPLGLLAPFVVKIKSFFQMLWLLELGWDDDLPHKVREQWLQIRDEITQITVLNIPRWLFMGHADCQLHGFCDSSEIAFAAAVYLRTSYNGQIVTNLIAAKTKVAPIKNISLPRLELNGALLLSKLIKHVESVFNFTNNQIFCWTDSTIVLDWLSEPPRRWKTYIANRTSEILEVIPRDRWGHITSKLNPADCATRGLSPNELASHLLWWNGPNFLVTSTEFWPSVRNPQTINLERRDKLQVMVAICPDTSQSIIEQLINHYSSYDKIINILATIQKFIKMYFRSKVLARNNTRHGWRDAEAEILKYTQRQYFSEEIRAIEKSNPVSTKSAIKALDPFLDDRNVLRVGGRIERAVAPYDTLHPIILPSKASITAKLIMKYHISNLHCGAALLLSIIRRRFWITNGKNTVKSTIRNCIKCIKQRPTTESQIMGNLPKERVELIRPFLKIGLDFAGPIKTYLRRGRGQRVIKSYICLIVCLSTKAIHLELVGDMTTDSFLAALYRFFARRGVSTDIFSDNGTNFRGASLKLKELNLFIKSNITLISNSIFEKYQVTWHFIPPQAPHFGGIWEAGVKSAKTHLERVIGSNILTREELNTLLAQIEGLLNSRPLCVLSDDDRDPLTPAHFLIGHPITTIPQPVIMDIPYNRLSHWNAIQRMTQLFWKRWHLEYLTSMQARVKWNSTKNNININDIVLVKEENPLVNQWKLGKIVEVFPGNDGRVRVAEILTSQGTIRRPITKLCRLPVY